MILANPKPVDLSDIGKLAGDGIEEDIIKIRERDKKDFNFLRHGFGVVSFAKTMARLQYEFFFNDSYREMMRIF